MQDLDIYPYGLDSLIILRQGEVDYSWENITYPNDFAYGLSSYQETNQWDDRSTNSSHYHQKLSSGSLPGRYIDNEGDVELGRINTQYVVWDSEGHIVVITGVIATSSPLRSLTITAPGVVMQNVTSDIREFHIKAIGVVGKDTDQSGSVIAECLGSKEEPIHLLNVTTNSFILSGDNWIYKSDIESLGLDNSKAITLRDRICDIDLSLARTFTGYDITLRVDEDAGCIAVGGTFLVENNLQIFGNGLRQTGLIAVKGLADIRANKLVIEGEIIIDKDVTISGAGSLLLRNSSSLGANGNITITGYESITLHGIFETSGSIEVESKSFEQTVKGSIATEFFMFTGESFKLCGNVSLKELRLESNRTEFCETATGNIERLYLTGGEFTQSSSIVIGSFEASGTAVRFLNSTSFKSLTLSNSSLEYQGDIYAANITADIVGNMMFGHQILASEMKFNVTGSIITKAKLRGISGEFIAHSFTNEADGYVDMDGMAIFLLRDRLDLNPRSKMHLGSVRIDAVNTVLNKGGQLIVRGTEVSSIVTNSLINQIEFYQKSSGTISCGSASYSSWICGRTKNSKVDRFFGSGSYENDYCSGSSSCVDEQHSYGSKGVIAVNGILHLSAGQITVELSNLWIKDLNLTTATIAPRIDSKHINRVVYVSSTIGVTGSPHSCGSIAASYGIAGGTCVATGSGHTITKAIGEVSSSFIVENVTGIIEEGLLINWQSNIGANQLAEKLGTALVPGDFFNQEAHGGSYYTNPAITMQSWNLDSIFGYSFSINSRLLRSLIPLQNIQDSGDGALTIQPFLISRSFSVVCDDQDGQDQLDCEQFSFLKKLGFTGDVPTQVDFGGWKEIVDTYVYQQTNFHLIKIISQYGSSVSMFRDFADIALKEYKSVGLVPGYPASVKQIEELSGPIIWPVWTDTCMSKDHLGNLYFTGIRCLSYELYIPNDYLIDQMSGAIFAGKRMDLTITGTTVIGFGGHLVQLDTSVTGKISKVEPGKGSISLAHESNEITVSEDGSPAVLIKVIGGDVIHLGEIAGRIGLHIEGGSYKKVGSNLNAIDQAIIVSDSSFEVPLVIDGQVIAQSRTTLLCTIDKADCVYHQKSTKSDIIKIATQSYIEGSSIIRSAGDFTETTLHTKTQQESYEGKSFVSRPIWATHRNQEYVTGRISHIAEGNYYGQGIAVFAGEGGEIYGQEGTNLEAITSIGQFYSQTTNQHRFTRKVTHVEALSTHGSLVEIETGDSSKPITIGSDEKTSHTTVRGLVSIGGPTGPGIVLRGGAGIDLLEHLIPELTKITVKRSGMLGRSASLKPDIGHIRGLRNIDSLKYKDWLGFTTGMITDLVSGLNIYNVVKGTKFLQNMNMAGGTAIAMALLSEVFHMGISFGEEVVVISQEGVTSVPSVSIGNSEIGEGSFGVYSSGNVNMEHAQVNVKEINGIILGNLVLAKGTDRQSTTTEREKYSLDFDLSLSSISAGVGISIGDQEQRVETHHPTTFFAQNVTLVVGEKLTIEGAIIDGKAVKIDAKEISIEDVVDTIRTRSNFVQAGVGLAFNFWTGSLAPCVSFGTGREIRDSDLVQFVSRITGQDVEVTAEKLSSSLDAITGQEDLKLSAKERSISGQKTNQLHHQAWSIGAGLSIGFDGKINPGLTPSFQEDGVRTSAVISADLFRGIEMIADKLTKTFRTIDAEDTTPGPEPLNKADPTPKARKEVAIEVQKQALAVLANKAVADIIAEAKTDINPQQEAALKEEFNKDLPLLLSGDPTTMNKYYKVRAYANNQLHDAKRSFVSKVLDIFDRLNPFGSRTAHANPALVAVAIPFIGIPVATLLAIAAVAGTIYAINHALSDPKTQELLAKSLNLASDAHDRYIEYHTERITRYAKMMEERMAKYMEQGHTQEAAAEEARKDYEKEQETIKKFREETRGEIAAAELTGEETFHHDALDTVIDRPRATSKPQTKPLPDTYGTPNHHDDDPNQGKGWTKNKDDRWHHPRTEEYEGIANKPNVQNTKLRETMDQIYRTQDKAPGGTAGKLRIESLEGSDSTGHLIKAEGRIKNLQDIIKNEKLSKLDRAAAESVIRDLRETMKLIRS